MKIQWKLLSQANEQKSLQTVQNRRYIEGHAEKTTNPWPDKATVGTFSRVSVNIPHLKTSDRA